MPTLTASTTARAAAGQLYRDARKWRRACVKANADGAPSEQRPAPPPELGPSRVEALVDDGAGGATDISMLRQRGFERAHLPNLFDARCDRRNPLRYQVASEEDLLRKYAVRVRRRSERELG